jgi:hypothetical protein
MYKQTHVYVIHANSPYLQEVLMRSTWDQPLTCIYACVCMCWPGILCTSKVLLAMKCICFCTEIQTYIHIQTRDGPHKWTQDASPAVLCMRQDAYTNTHIHRDHTNRAHDWSASSSICICMHTYIYIYIYIYMYTMQVAYAKTHIHADRTNRSYDRSACSYAWGKAWPNSFRRFGRDVWSWYVMMCMHVCMYVCAQQFQALWKRCVKLVRDDVYACVYVCMCPTVEGALEEMCEAGACWCVCMCVCMYVPNSSEFLDGATHPTPIFIHTYIYIYIHIYTQAWSHITLSRRSDLTLHQGMDASQSSRKNH